MSQPSKPTTRSFYTYASNASSVGFGYRERFDYKTSIIPSLGLNHEYNFWGKEQFYGRLNQGGESIYIQESQLKPMRYSDTPVPAMALNFVADAWRDFVDRVIDEANQGILFKDGPYHNIRAAKTWRSMTSAYHQYLLETIYPVFIGSFLAQQTRRGKKIIGMKGFLECFDEFANKASKDGTPITLSSYATSGYCSLLNTGLAIEISDAPHDVDFEKCKKFLYDGNFNRVRQIASYYGFVIDPNAPWRFVADLGSQPMIEYMVGVSLTQNNYDPRNEELVCDDLNELETPRPEAYGFSQIPGLEGVIRHARGYGAYGGLTIDSSPQEVYNRVFQVAYQKTWQNDMDFLQVYMVQFYNAYVDTNPQVSIPAAASAHNIRAGCSEKPPQIIQNVSVGLQNFKTFYGDKWSLVSYYKFRMQEIGVKRTKSGMNIDVRRFLDVFYKTRGNKDLKYLQALTYIHEQILIPHINEQLNTSQRRGTIG